LRNFKKYKKVEIKLILLLRFYKYFCTRKIGGIHKHKNFIAKIVKEYVINRFCSKKILLMEEKNV